MAETSRVIVTMAVTNKVSHDMVAIVLLTGSEAHVQTINLPLLN